MDEYGERRVRAKSSGDGIDRLSNLPESLKFEILLKLPTKDVVKTSVLSKGWGELWPLVPGLDLDFGDFSDRNAFLNFVDRFLGFGKSCLQNFKLDVGSNWNCHAATKVAHVTRWIDVVLKRRVQCLHVSGSFWGRYGEKQVEIPLRIYTCESLVSVRLVSLILANPKSVSLPCIKDMYLEYVTFANDRTLEMLISGCPGLKTLYIYKGWSDNVKVSRVCSQSLLSFTYNGHGAGFHKDDHHMVVIDAPRLEYLKLHDYETESFILINMGSLVKVDINITFNLDEKRIDPNDLPMTNMFRNFLVGISQVKDMVVSSNTLEIIYNFSRCEQPPLFCNMSSLCGVFRDYRWEILPIFLESCPNLKTLTLEFNKIKEHKGVSILPGPKRFLTTLEYVQILQPIADESTEINLVSYFLENSTVLKKFTYVLGDSRRNEESVILKKLFAIPRLSSSCQVLVL